MNIKIAYPILIALTCASSCVPKSTTGNSPPPVGATETPPAPESTGQGSAHESVPPSPVQPPQERDVLLSRITKHLQADGVLSKPEWNNACLKMWTSSFSSIQQEEFFWEDRENGTAEDFLRLLGSEDFVGPMGLADSTIADDYFCGVREMKRWATTIHSALAEGTPSKVFVGCYVESTGCAPRSPADEAQALGLLKRLAERAESLPRSAAENIVRVEQRSKDRAVRLKLQRERELANADRSCESPEQGAEKERTIRACILAGHKHRPTTTYAGDPAATRSAEFFSNACSLGSGEGCYYQAELSGKPYWEVTERYRKACQLGYQPACVEDGGCLEAQETGVSYDGCNERGECSVTSTTSTGSTGTCQRWCSAGMPGACFRLEILYSWCEEGFCREKEAFYQAQACKYGHQPSCKN